MAPCAVTAAFHDHSRNSVDGRSGGDKLDRDITAAGQVAMKQPLGGTTLLGILGIPSGNGFRLHNSLPGLLY
ncbi:MAG: hypothetical protein WD825_15835 [Gemmatimonadaceae bacterium]